MSPKVMLLSMPWATALKASISVGCLHAYLEKRGVEVESPPWRVNIASAIGPDRYLSLCAEATDISEAFYSYLYFPTMRKALLKDKRIQRIVKDLNARFHYEKSPLKFRWTASFFKEFEALHQRLLDQHDWQQYTLVGFSLNFFQAVASLYMAREIKKRNPRCKIIMGGYDACGELGVSLLNHFPEVDYACNGEGEYPLYHIWEALHAGHDSTEQISQISGLIYRNESGEVIANHPDQMKNLGEIETPNFDEYFEAIHNAPNYEHNVEAAILIESSRGCAFNCSFCGLNIQWQNFRSRPTENVLENMRALCEKHQMLNFVFVDNLPPVNLDDICEGLSHNTRDYRFWYQVRANLSQKTFAHLKHAGLDIVQVGIEALSSSLLKKFNKKVRMITQLQCFKFCTELGIPMNGNLISNYPFSTEHEVHETLQMMEWCRAYYPPSSISPFALMVGSPDYAVWSERGFKKVWNHENYRRVYPRHLYKTLNLPRKSFTVEGGKTDWRPIIKPLHEWQKFHRRMIRELGTASKILAYYDGGNFMKIEDHRSGHKETYYLNEKERALYLFANEIRPWNSFRGYFPEMADAELRAILNEFVASKLMFEEDGMYLGLAMSPYPERKMAALLNSKEEPVNKNQMLAVR